jgi:hypothetical protein
MRSFFISIAVLVAGLLAARVAAQETTRNGDIPHFQGEMSNVPISRS